MTEILIFKILLCNLTTAYYSPNQLLSIQSGERHQTQNINPSDLIKMATILLQQLYQQWCKETKRNGSVLVGSSILEFFIWVDGKANVFSFAEDEHEWDPKS